MTACDGGLKHLPGQRSERKGHVEFGGGVQHEADVLVHPLYGKVGGEVAAEDEGGLVLDQAGFGGAVREDVEHHGGLDASFGAKDDALVKGLQDIGENQVLSQFGVQAGSGATTIIEFFPHRLQIRFHPLEYLLVAADHKW